MKLGKGVCVFLVLALVVPVVYAQSLPGFTRDTVESAIDTGTAIFEPLFEVILGQYSTSEFFFAKSLLVILLFAIISSVLKVVPQFKDQKAVSAVIAIIVSIFAVRFIAENELTQGILLPYGVLGLALTTLLPFVLFAYFVHARGFGGFGRRILWAVFGIIFLVFWLSRASSIPGEANWIFILTILGIIIAFIFDRGIHGYFSTHEMNTFRRGAGHATIAKLQAEYLNILHVNSRDAEIRRADIVRQLRALGATVP